jgi:SAM-dependent methyltransferase
MERYFIQVSPEETHIQTFSGKDAEDKIKEQNDLIYLDSDGGIHNVPKERWYSAQKYENLTWKGTLSSDDRNFDHMSKFEDLICIKDYIKKAGSIIELGCGPFTNVRLYDTDANITLLDPLINNYLNIENCPYRDGKMKGRDVSLISSPIEEFNTSDKYDIIVMINVIEHCFSVDLIFNKILEILKPGGIFIFSDVYFNEAEFVASRIYDAGHPLKLSEIRMNNFLSNFSNIFEKRYHKLHDQDWRNDVYFVGKKM